MAITSGGGGYAELAAVDRAHARAAARRRDVRRGRVVPAHVPHRVHPADAAGARSRTARRCSCTRRPAASARRRSRSRARSARAWSRPSARRRSSSVCRELGAEEAYVYDELPDDLRVDVVVDPVGGELFAGCRSRDCKPLGAARRDRLRAAGSGPRSQPARLVGRNVGLQGFYLGRLLRHRARGRRRRDGELLELWQTGALIRPLVGAEFPLDEVEQAHELVESRRSVGKVVLSREGA